jgi:hypothetical protein
VRRPRRRCKRADPGSSRNRASSISGTTALISVFTGRGPSTLIPLRECPVGRDHPYLLGLMACIPLGPNQLGRCAGEDDSLSRAAYRSVAHAVGLEGLLREFLRGPPAKLRQLVGRWVSLRKRTCAGWAMGTESGLDTIVGVQVYV